ncbi:hypothetical protein GY45DRAFT_559881 [Cubamyces sp. BRFM 1775]|nr:hypothetical protein GY45DRAFT_559881 [Cubamyces sp. BRFM 1775]
MTTDTPNTGKGGASGDPTVSGTPQGGQPPSKPPSPAIPALVVICLVLFSGILAWWFVKKLRRSRRYAPAAMELAELNNDRPVLWDVEVGQAVAATKKYETRWDKLQPVMVSYVPSDIDSKRSPSNINSSAYLPTSSRSPRPSSVSFSIFSPVRKADIHMASTRVPRDITVAVMILMPSEHGSLSGGELCLGVTHSSV